jgi:hypothetical protein
LGGSVVSDFILPDDIRQMAYRSSQDIADAWDMLVKVCVIKQYPFEMAESKVVHLIKVNQLNEIEAIRKVYNKVVYG